MKNQDPAFTKRVLAASVDLSNSSSGNAPVDTSSYTCKEGLLPATTFVYAPNPSFVGKCTKQSISTRSSVSHNIITNETILPTPKRPSTAAN